MILNEENKIYEYVAVYVDDVAIEMKYCDKFISILQDKYNIKLKGKGTITYHLGMDFFRDQNYTLCMTPRKYIENTSGSFKRIFSHKTKQKYTSPIEKNYHLKLHKI